MKNLIILEPGLHLVGKRLLHCASFSFFLHVDAVVACGSNMKVRWWNKLCLANKITKLIVYSQKISKYSAVKKYLPRFPFVALISIIVALHNPNTLEHQIADWLPESKASIQYIFTIPLQYLFLVWLFTVECYVSSSLFLMVILSEGNEAYSCLDVCLGSLMTSYISDWCALGGILILQVCPLLGLLSTFAVWR